MYILLPDRGVGIPFIKLDDIDDVKMILRKGGCKPGVCGPSTYSYSLPGQCCLSSRNINSYDIAVKLNERYFRKGLPHKFKFGVTGCQNNCLKARRMM